LIILFDIF
jgi:hypothetical protein